MNIERLHVFHGPNPWAGCPLVEFTLTAEGSKVSLADAKRIAALTQSLQAQVGTPVGFAATRQTDAGCVVAVEFVDAALGQAACEIACRMANAGASEPTREELEQLTKLEYQQRLPPSVRVVYEGAKRHGIPIVKLSPEYSGYFVLGQGSRQKRLRWSEPDAISGVARLASTDKYLTNQLLASIGIPVPKGRLISTAEEAWAAANEVGLPVAVKPYNCDLQTGVSLDLHTQERVEAAFQAAVEHSSWVLVEHFAPGLEHRVLVTGEKISAVTRIDPPHVVGDGVSTIGQLVEKTNSDPRRGDDDRSSKPLSKIKLDDVALKVIASQDMTLDSVPPAGKTVLVRRDPPYFKNGGTLTDLTDVIHPETVAHVVAASRMMQIPVAGLDVVALDISKPLGEQGGVIVEINANPGLWLHMAPWADDPRPIGDDIAQWMFPDPETSRIPIIALIGDASRSVERQFMSMLARSGCCVGVASPEEFAVGERRWPACVATARERAYLLLRNPAVDVAVLHVTEEELAAHGFPTDRCQAAILAKPVAESIRETLRHVTNDVIEPQDPSRLEALTLKLTSARSRG
ncbi:MAG: acetate--CoA ligase family protein [Gemmataceae bacterium]|nr:acetate--CoA ligase family protein [Gemmataceae bacterium]